MFFVFSAHDLDTFEPKVLATALGLDIDYPLNESEGCKELVDDECPLEEGQRVIYATTMEIKKSFPTVSSKVIKQHDLFCFVYFMLFIHRLMLALK